MNDSPARTTLLILDDEQSVCRALGRVLGRNVDEVICVNTPADAQTVLDSKPVTHLLCDQLLGPGQEKGMNLATRWRSEYPSIVRIIILTGTHTTDVDVPEGIDKWLPKTTDPFELAAHLGLK